MAILSASVCAIPAIRRLATLAIDVDQWHRIGSNGHVSVFGPLIQSAHS